MSRRVTEKVERPAAVSIVVNGVPVPAYEGESIMTAVMASGRLSFTRSRFGRPRGPFCNMGVCFDCLVLIEDTMRPEAKPTRVRSCLATVREGLSIAILQNSEGAIEP
jgi:D-hydroxyproline dehydrogenase subunit gamma